MSGSRSWARRNPPAAAADYRQAFRLTATIAAEYRRRGASAVVLSGSWARGDAHRWSDLDLWVLGRRTGHRVRHRSGLLVSVTEKTAAAEARDMSDPARLGQAVLAWRECRPVLDPVGAASRLVRKARDFRWARVRARARRHVSRTLAEWAEEAVKLTRFLAEEHWESAAVQRNLLANALAGLMAVHLELLYRENELWETVGARMGRRWHRAQRTALAVGGVSVQRSSEAALRLYCLSADAVTRTLEREDRRVIERVCAQIGTAR